MADAAWRASAALAAGVALVAGLAGTAAAQRANERDEPRPLIVQWQDESVESQRPAAPMSQDQTARLVEARRLRESGLIAKAQTLVDGLLAELPHHALVLRERARLMLARGEHQPLERMARAERAALKDSVVLSRELTQALEHLGRHKDAAQIAVETWVAEPREGPWAAATTVRLLSNQPNAIRDIVRRAAARAPDRVDLALGLARVEWRLGDVRAALNAVTDLDVPGSRPFIRWTLGDEMIRAANGRDSMAATEMWLDLAADARHDVVVRTSSARRAWEVFERRGVAAQFADRVVTALAALNGAQWPADLRIAVARALQGSGKGAEARALLETPGGAAGAEPKIAVERALADLREGPPERALAQLEKVAGSSSDAAFRYAEALFFAGMTDSAEVWYKQASADPTSAEAGAALERLFLIEEANPPAAARAFGEIAYRRWRGDARTALTLTDSLYRSLAPSPTWALAALMLSELRETTGDKVGALEPVLAVVEKLPDDRQASRARQRAGDLYAGLGETAKAVEQYEECLARYPRAWNAPEVRRKLETLRRERRF